MPAPLDLKAVLEELERTAPGASRVLLLAAATPGPRSATSSRSGGSSGTGPILPGRRGRSVRRSPRPPPRC